jgi:hypothetical protein
LAVLEASAVGSLPLRTRPPGFFSSFFPGTRLSSSSQGQMYSPPSLWMRKTRLIFWGRDWLLEAAKAANHTLNIIVMGGLSPDDGSAHASGGSEAAVIIVMYFFIIRVVRGGHQKTHKKERRQIQLRKK